MRASSPIAKGPTRTIPVFSRERKQVERMTPSAHLRLRLMYDALQQGLEYPPGVTYWPALAPLKAVEKVGVQSEVTRLLGMSPADRSAELILMKAEGNIP